MDFLVTQNLTPWLLIEVKLSDKADLSTSLGYFQQQTKAQHAFQVALTADYVDKNCFEACRPTIVPARTFLPQLV